MIREDSMVRIRFGDCIPFPSNPGAWLRFVLMTNPNKEDSLVITQGHVMIFEGEEVTMLDKGQKTTAETIMKGDLLCQQQGLTVAYTPVLGASIIKAAAPASANGKTPLASKLIVPDDNLSTG